MQSNELIVKLAMEIAYKDAIITAMMAKEKGYTIQKLIDSLYRIANIQWHA